MSSRTGYVEPGHARPAVAVWFAAVGLASVVTVLGCAVGSNDGGGAAVTAFSDVRVFDGADVHERTTVVVRGGQIEALGPDVAVPTGATIIEGAGRTLLPGLIDAHSHTGGFGRVLEAMAVFGVTTTLDMASSPANVAAIKAEQDATGATNRADLFSAGLLLTAPGGHGTQYPTPMPTIRQPDEAAALVADRVADGADYIKIVYDAWAAGRGPDAALERRPSMSRAALAAIIREAHNAGKLAVVHVLNERSAREAVLEGADGLVHLFAATTFDDGTDEDFADLAREHGVFVIPTVSVLLAPGAPPNAAGLLGDPALGPYMSPDQSQTLATRVASAPWHPEPAVRRALLERTIGRLRDEGVPILAGTDVPNPGTSYGVSLHGEMLLLVDLGLAPTEVLTAATAAPATVFGLADRGRIQPGLRADLVLVDGDPTVDIRATRSIVGVWKRGVVIDRAPAR